MEVTCVEQSAYIKIAVRQGRNSLCDFDLIPKIKEPVRSRRFATRKDIANAVRQQVTRFTHMMGQMLRLKVFSDPHTIGTVW
ncbi:uncharacterized protein TNCV_428561 [Trichonephila clavipes]|nr:uncharacterized protein TNCV_428561 [Trichonephila clavipes]